MYLYFFLLQHEKDKVNGSRTLEISWLHWAIESEWPAIVYWPTSVLSESES